MVMSPVHQVWPKPSCKAQWKGEEDRQRKRWEDNIREWTGLEFGRSQRAVESREKWRKLVAKSSVVPQRPSQLRDRWDDEIKPECQASWWREHVPLKNLLSERYGLFIKLAPALQLLPSSSNQNLWLRNWVRNYGLLTGVSAFTRRKPIKLAPGVWCMERDNDQI